MLPLAIVLAVLAASSPTPAATHRPAASHTPPPDPVIAAVGDLVCDPRPHSPLRDLEDAMGDCDAAKTFALVADRHLAAILILGDEQYEDGALEAFKLGYAKTWGLRNAIARPVPGNHEYYSSPTAAGYFTYFGAAAGDPSKGYYSFNIGTWHIVALNGNCTFIGGCQQGSPEEKWLKADLRADRARCTIAYWHQPRFSSGFHGDDPQYAAFWNDLYAAHADLVLGGHDHDYERFAPMSPSGAVDRQLGIREIVAGTGGRSHTFFLKIHVTGEARSSGTFGVLFLTLHPSSYDWQFTPIAGYYFSDHGSDVCHGGTASAGKPVSHQ